MTAKSLFRTMISPFAKIIMDMHSNKKSSLLLYHHLILGLVVITTVATNLCTDLNAQESKAQVWDALPTPNKRILARLNKDTSISRNWNKPHGRHSNRSMYNMFRETPDQIAFRRLMDHVFDIEPDFGELPNGDWEISWEKVWTGGGSSGFETNVTTVPRGGQLAFLGVPSVPASGKFGADYPGPLPGDVIIFKGPLGKKIFGVYAGNRRFPKRNRLVSFFYFADDYSSFLGKSKLDKVGGTVFNSYPPRLTPLIYKRLFPTADKGLNPNSKVFRGAGGYLSSFQQKAYAGYYIPTFGKSWTSKDKFIVLRRKPYKIKYFVSPNVPFVSQFNQQKGKNDPYCWAAVVTMLYSWADGKTRKVDDVMIEIGSKVGDADKWLDVKNAGGIRQSEKKQLVADSGRLGAIKSNSFSASDWLKMLKTYGPLWVSHDQNVEEPGGHHVMVMYGIVGDGTEKGTFVYCKNPAWHKKQIRVLSLEKFREMFEWGPIVNQTKFIQIIYIK